MAEPHPADPVKLFVAILWSECAALDRSVVQMSEIWGPVDFVGPDHPFDMTNYYEPEMGASLQRRLIGFEQLFHPDRIGEAKLACNAIEERLSCEGRRHVNLDIGYLDHNKIVLASMKYGGQKIYLGAGIYADLIARYEGGRYRPFAWTFPDFRDGAV